MAKRGICWRRRLDHTFAPVGRPTGNAVAAADHGGLEDDPRASFSKTCLDKWRTRQTLGVGIDLAELIPRCCDNRALDSLDGLDLGLAVNDPRALRLLDM